MTIYFNSFSQSAVHLITETIFPALTSQPKRIYAIVALALASSAAAYWMWRCSKVDHDVTILYDSKDFKTARLVMLRVYVYIEHYYKEKLVVAKPEASVIQLERDLGKKVEDEILKHYYPSYTANYLKAHEKSPPYIPHLRDLHETFSKIFNRCNTRERLCSVVLQAEKSWLAALLDRYTSHPEERETIAEHLAFVVNKDHDPISKEKLQDRLNHFIALLNVFYQSHGLGHNYVTGRVPQTYFKEIFQ